LNRSIISRGSSSAVTGRKLDFQAEGFKEKPQAHISGLRADAPVTGESKPEI
jgi:hypothetical protein